MHATRSSRSASSRRRSRLTVRTLLHDLESRVLMSALFTQTNIVSDGAVTAITTDARLKNPWGMSYLLGGPFWISDNGTSMTTVYNNTGGIQSTTVAIPGAGGAASAPTGQISNTTSDFVVTSGTNSGAAWFIFTGEDGGISGWNPSVDPNNAILTVDHSSDGAVFKGLTMTTINGSHFLLAADFHNNKIDIFNGTFNQVTMAGAFVDPKIKNGFAPFNVQKIGGKVYVMYAKQDAAAHDDVAGAGNGYVDVFSAGGKLLKRFQHTNMLNSPWGVAQAPASWGAFAGDTLVGNFGNGQIDVFNPKSGAFITRLHDAKNKVIAIDGLWALSFGNGGQAGSTSTLFFTAGLNDEADGLFGNLTLARKGQQSGQGAQGGGIWM